MGFGEREAKKYVEKEMTANPEMAAMVYQTLGRLRSGYYDNTPLADVIVQKHRDYDILDAYAFSLVYVGIMSGEILTCEVQVAEEPGRDDDIYGNNEILHRELAQKAFGFREDGKEEMTVVGSPFEARFIPGRGSGAYDDGWFRWVAPIHFQKRVYENGKVEYGEHVLVDPWEVPLEVGTTDGHTTFQHLIYRKGVARWPYESTSIWVLFTPDGFRPIDKIKID